MLALRLLTSPVLFLAWFFVPEEERPSEFNWLETSTLTASFYVIALGAFVMGMLVTVGRATSQSVSAPGRLLLTFLVFYVACGIVFMIRSMVHVAGESIKDMLFEAPSDTESIQQ